jgi:dCTP diphosphatase
MPDLRNAERAIQRFNEARGWDQHHRPRSLILALVGEVGELAELAQWRSDEALEAAPADLRGRLEAELADIQIYVLNLARALNVDLAKAVELKVEANGTKHPVQASRRNPYGGKQT